MNFRVGALLLVAIGLILPAFFGAKAPVSSPVIEPKIVKAEVPVAKLSTTGAQTAIAETTQPEKINQAWLDREALKMNRLDSNPEATLARMKRAAEASSESDRDLLVHTVMDPEAAENARGLSMQMLVLSGKASTEQFYKIASMSEPPGGNDFHDNLISSLAVAALEQIQNRALKNPSLISDLQKLSEQSKDRYVQQMAREMKSAVARGQLITAEVQ